MSFHARMTAFPADLVDTDLDATLDFVRSDLGAAGLSLWAAAPAAARWRTRSTGSPLYRTRGGLLFQPDDNHYADTRCKPLVSESARGRRMLERVAEACAARDMPLRLILSATRIGRLADRYPEMAAKNVFGDVSRKRLCLVNPDVQAMLRALVNDLRARLSADAVTLTDWTLGWSDDEIDTIAGPPALRDPAVRAAMTICFCESCRQQAGAAGVDMDAAARSAQHQLSVSLDHATRTTVSDGTASDALTPWRDWARHTLTDLLQRLSAACPTEFLLAFGVHGSAENRPHPDAAVVDGLILPLRLAQVSRTQPSLSARRVELSVPAEMTLSEGPEVVAALPRAAVAGVATVTFEDYTLLPEPALATVR